MVLVETGRTSYDADRLISTIPTDLPTARKAFGLDPEFRTYVCCPQCFALYPSTPADGAGSRAQQNGTNEPSESPDNPPCDILPFWSGSQDEPRSWSSSPYPLECTFKETSNSSSCGTRLLRDAAAPTFNADPDRRRGAPDTGRFQRTRPIRTYSHQTLESWMARMLSRPDIEDYVDRSQSTANQGTDDTEDIMESAEIHGFLDSSGQPFIRVEGTEGRLLFSLFVDWFSARGNRTGSASYSSGVIFMVCLNLPPTLRYRRENVYLAGVMPGPKAPSLEEINHLLDPLVEELVEMWVNGLYFSQTARHSNGRLVRCAIVPLVCDLGALRKTAGAASHSMKYFCSYCQLEKGHINSLRRAEWPTRTCDEHRKLAEQWRDAATVKEREELFNATGIRYSVLLKLPYWRPTRFIVIEAMHNLFLGLFQRHCRNVLGMNINVESSFGLEDESEDDPVLPEEMDAAERKIGVACDAEEMKKSLTRRLLRAAYRKRGLGDPGSLTKIILAQAIFEVRLVVYGGA